MSGLRSRWAAIGAAVAVTLGAGGLVSVSADSAESVFVAVTPTRVLDTRTGVGLSGVFVSDAGRKLDVTGTVAVVNADGSTGSRVVVPEGATAIVGNLTAVSPSSRGFVSIRPGTASGVPTTSNVNIPAPGVNVPNAVTVELPVSGPSAGRVDLFYRALDAGASTHLLLDIVGYYLADGAVPGPPGQNGVRIAEPIWTTVASAGYVGDFNAVTVGLDGNPVISYRDFDKFELRVAVCADPACTSSTTTVVDSNGNFNNIAIALGADGNPVIAYIDDSLGDSPDLKIAVCADPVCRSARRTTLVFDEASGVYAGVSVAISPDGRPVVSFLHRDPSVGLALAVCSTPTCTSSLVVSVDATSSGVGYQSSVTIGATGYPVISYVDTTNRTLKLAWCINPSCTLNGKRTLDTFTDSATLARSAVAIGADGSPVVSYFDSTSDNLKLAVCNDWTCSSALYRFVDTDGGFASSVAIGVDGNPVISYVNGNGFIGVKIAACGDPLCFSSLITGIAGLESGDYYTSLTIGADGNPFVSYFDTIVDDLKVHACGNTLCSPFLRVGR